MSLNEIDFSNKYTKQVLLQKGLYTIIKHPFVYVKTLIQIGYEPIKPVLKDNFFFGSKYTYPNVFKYLSYISQIDGFPGIFRGVTFHLFSDITNEFIYMNCLNITAQAYKLNNPNSEIDVILDESNSDDFDKSTNEIDLNNSRNELNETKNEKINFKHHMKLFFEKILLETISKSLALAVSYPLHVCFIRSCAQFVGREKIYNDLSFNIFQILKLGGLYDGFVPKLLSDILILWLSTSFVRIAKVCIQPDAIIETYINLIGVLIIPSAFYSYQLTSTVMAINNCNSILASKLEPKFMNWRLCKNSLSERNHSKRGSKLVMRYLATDYKPQIYPRNYMNKED